MINEYSEEDTKKLIPSNNDIDSAMHGNMEDVFLALTGHGLRD